MKHVLEADGIYLDFYKRNILSSVYIKCETRQITGLLGRNGAGKSCLMNIIYGRLPSQSKSVRFDAVSIPAAWKQPGLLRYAPQFHFIPGSLSVKQVFHDFELDFGEYSRHFPEFAGLYRSLVKNLSGGHRRLLEIYVILCSKTTFVMLDEPFSHIMPLHIEKLRELFTEEKKNKGILISDHLYEHVVKVSDAIYLLRNGNTHQIRDTGEIESLGYIRP